MKLTVFGATGPNGEQIVRHGLAAGHEVTAVVRNPDAMRVADPRLRVITGDVLQPESVPPAVAGAGAVLSALGSRTMRQPTTVYSAGTLVAASDRDWTVFRPPRLTDAAATGRYRLAVDARCRKPGPSREPTSPPRWWPPCPTRPWSGTW